MNEISVNRRAHFDYQILETLEAGIELLGHEVKSVKSGHMSLAGSFAIIRNSEAFLLNATISPFQPKNTPKNYDSERLRRLLLKKSEIRELTGKTAHTGLTIVPLKVYIRRGLIKVSLGLARHKKNVDKRETIKKRESNREINRELKRG